ncbi:unnamed protein product, partial [Rangifer tarandus platyrhynchus]
MSGPPSPPALQKGCTGQQSSPGSDRAGLCGSSQAPGGGRSIRDRRVRPSGAVSCAPKPEAAAEAPSVPVPGPWDYGAAAGPVVASEDQPGRAAGPPAPWGGSGRALCPGD